MTGKLIAGLLGGLLIGAFVVPVAGMVALQFGVSLDRYIMVMFGGCVGATTLLAALTGRPARAWRFTLLAAGAAALLLIVLHMLWSGAGALDRPAVMISFVAGTVLLLIGLLVGRNESA